ncbi:MAG: TadE/TadG family type IV pilus assembly protein [Candidatus Korobacteraceae bacterium]
MTKRNDSGQALIEVAFSIGIFLLLVMGTIEFGNLFNTKSTLQNAVRQAGRYAITGQCIGGAGTCTESRYNSILTKVENTSDGYINSGNVATDVSVTCADGGSGCLNSSGTADPAGGPGDLITITVTYPYAFVTGPIAKFFGGGTYTITVSSSFKNEAFPPSQS